MANRRSKNRAFACQTKLPPLRRKYDTTQSPMLQDFGEGNFPSRFLRLPRIECCPLVQSKTALPFRGDEENMYPCLTIDEQSPPFCQVVKKCGKAFERMDGFKEPNRTEKASMRSEIPRKNGANRASNYSSKKEGAQILPGNAFRRPAHLLRRHLKPERVYRYSNGPMSHEELLAFDQNMDQLRVFTERDVKWVQVKDFSGKKIDPNKTEDDDITSYIQLFQLEDRKKNCQDEAPLKTETKTRVQGRYFEALDLHFYHYYRNTHPERRMAICEEIERSIVVDDVALTCFREHLSLQEIINTWVV